MIYASKHEEKFAHWLDEMKLMGFVAHWSYEPHTYVLIASNDFFRSHTYTPDFEVTWAKEPPIVRQRGFKWVLKDMKTVIEIKPSFDRYNMTRLFKVNQKIMFEKYKTYVHLVKIEQLFKHTFTPGKSKEQFFLDQLDKLTDKQKKAKILYIK